MTEFEVMKNAIIRQYGADSVEVFKMHDGSYQSITVGYVEIEFIEYKLDSVYADTDRIVSDYTY